MNNELKTLKFCVKIFKSGKEYITEAINYISEKDKKNEFTIYGCILLFNVLDKDNKIRFLLYSTEIIENENSITAFEIAEEPLNKLLDVHTSIYENLFASVIVQTKDKNQLGNILKYGIYLIKKNNLDMLTIDFISDIFLDYIKFKVFDNNN